MKNQAFFSSKDKSKQLQEGHGGPGLLTCVSYEPRIFKLPYFGIK